MIEWKLVDITVIAVVLIAAGFAIRYILRNRKSIGCSGCSSCPSYTKCTKR